MTTDTPATRKDTDPGTDNARQSDYWQRVGGHDPEGYQDYDEDEK